MDSGASTHISFDVHNFLNLELNPCSTFPTVTFGDNNELKATGIGSVKFLLRGINDGPSTTMILDDVLFIPEAAANLFSVKKLAWHGQSVVFAGD
jgi:hypothetical protein